jgi:quercetin dioxygenase-like cupin family protein
MRILDKHQAESYAVEGVEVTRWEQFQLTSTVPFQAMWYEVPAGGAAPLDQHPERELSVVVSGEAEVQASGATHVVTQGQAFLLEGQEAHRVHNRSPKAPLLVLSVYWMPERAGELAAAAAGDGGESNE